MKTGQEENQEYTKPCRVDKVTPCIQYPDDDCGCDYCKECEVGIKFLQTNKPTKPRR